MAEKPSDAAQERVSRLFDAEHDGKGGEHAYSVMCRAFARYVDSVENKPGEIENPRAFPSAAIDDKYGGMTLRDKFAEAALTGLIIREGGINNEWSSFSNWAVCRNAYAIADIMLAERAQATPMPDALNPTPEQVAIRIAQEIVPDGFCSVHALTLSYRESARSAALTAIVETTERAAKTCEVRGHVTSADALRNGDHLK